MLYNQDLFLSRLHDFILYVSRFRYLVLFLCFYLIHLNIVAWYCLFSGFKISIYWLQEHDEWEVKNGSVYFQKVKESAPCKEIPSLQLINQTLSYARELERIVWKELCAMASWFVAAWHDFIEAKAHLKSLFTITFRIFVINTTFMASYSEDYTSLKDQTVFPKICLILNLRFMYAPSLARNHETQVFGNEFGGSMLKRCPYHTCCVRDGARN
jgi:hypothetical protein